MLLKYFALKDKELFSEFEKKNLAFNQPLKYKPAVLRTATQCVG